jgi:hypothetical protein
LAAGLKLVRDSKNPAAPWACVSSDLGKAWEEFGSGAKTQKVAKRTG